MDSESRKLVARSSFCWNPTCPVYGKLDEGNICKYRCTSAGTQRCQWKVCHQTCVATIGTVFYKHYRSQETSIACLALLAERNSLKAIHRGNEVKEETVMEWLRTADDHVERIEALFLAHYQIDASPT